MLTTICVLPIVLLWASLINALITGLVFQDRQPVHPIFEYARTMTLWGAAGGVVVGGASSLLRYSDFWTAGIVTAGVVTWLSLAVVAATWFITKLNFGAALARVDSQEEADKAFEEFAKRFGRPAAHWLAKGIGSVARMSSFGRYVELRKIVSAPSDAPSREIERSARGLEDPRRAALDELAGSVAAWSGVAAVLNRHGVQPEERQAKLVETWWRLMACTPPALDGSHIPTEVLCNPELLDLVLTAADKGLSGTNLGAVACRYFEGTPNEREMIRRRYGVLI
jgi:hypothetical protein